MTLGFGTLGSEIGRVAGCWVEIVRLGDNFLSKSELKKMFPKIDFSVLKEVEADNICRINPNRKYSKKVCYADSLKDWYSIAKQLKEVFGKKWQRKLRFHLSECEIKKGGL